MELKAVERGEYGIFVDSVRLLIARLPDLFFGDWGHQGDRLFFCLANNIPPG